MYKEIDAELEALKKRLFTGYIRFGVEHGEIQTMSVTSKVEPISNFIDNLKCEIEKFCPNEDDFFGSVEYIFSFGKVTSCNYSISLHGEPLKKRLRETQGREVIQCKSVKIAVKK